MSHRVMGQWEAVDEGKCHAVRAVVRFADGQETATPWYEKGCIQVMDELLVLVKPQAEQFRVTWENKIVPKTDDCCRK